MPQFILDTQGTVPDIHAEGTRYGMNWGDLDEFTQGYIQAMFWTNTGSGDSVEWATPEYQHRMHEGQTDGELPNDVGFSDLDPDILAGIISECEAFQKANATLLEQAYDLGQRNGTMSYGLENAGHDYWLTRVGSGAGFFDRQMGAIGEALDKACDRREINPYFQDGKVHL